MFGKSTTIKQVVMVGLHSTFVPKKCGFLNTFQFQLFNPSPLAGLQAHRPS